MNIRDQWIEALRSGKYEQGTGQLRISGYATARYCCIGVLALLVDPLQRHWVDGDSVLPDVLVAMLDNSLSFYQDNEDELIEMNDGGYTFGEIAAEIDERFGDE